MAEHDVRGHAPPPAYATGRAVHGPHGDYLTAVASTLQRRTIPNGVAVAQRARLELDGKWYCDVSTGITTPFDTRAEAELAEQAHVALTSGTMPSGGSAGVAVASGDPASDEAAEREIATIEGQLHGKDIVLLPPSRPSRGKKVSRPDGTRLDDIAKKNLSTVLAQHGLTADPGTSGLSAGVVMRLLARLVAVRKWRDEEHARSGAFGYGAVPTIALPQSSMFSSTYRFTPFAPEMHNRPIGQAPPGSTFEQLGSDMVFRGKSEEELSEQRSSSKAYRAPSKKHTLRGTAPYPAAISGGDGTILDSERMSRWRHEHRKKEAKVGPHKGKKWPDQKVTMGKMSAQDAVASYNALVDPSARISTRLPYEWLHLFAFSMGGIDNLNPQEAGNLVVGTQFANLYHAAFEKAAKELASSGLRIQVHSYPSDPVSVEWRIYRYIHYSVSILETTNSNMFGPITRAAKTMYRQIACLEKPLVHTSDADALKHEILRELGVITPEYRDAVDKVFSGPRPSGGAHGLGAPSSSSSHAMGEDEADPLMAMALRMSVQEAARQLGVDRAFRVGHADGEDDNCSILSAFAAANHGLSGSEAAYMRTKLKDLYDIPLGGPLDLGDRYVSRAIADLVKVYTGSARTIVVIRPNRGGYALTPMAGSGTPVYLFYFGAHFSPAHKR